MVDEFVDHEKANNNHRISGLGNRGMSEEIEVLGGKEVKASESSNRYLFRQKRVDNEWVE
jgi:hypothetical protein